MFRDAVIIFKKDLKNLFKSKSTIFFILIFPMIIMPMFFGFIVFIENSQMSKVQTTVYDIEILNNNDPVFLKLLSQHLQFNIVNTKKDDNFIKIEFPKGYAPSNRAVVRIYYNSISSNLKFAAQIVQNVLDEYQRFLANKILKKYNLNLSDIYTISVKKIDLAPKNSQNGEFAAVLIPMFIVIYVFMGSMNIGMDSTVGEKVRGSFTLILVNQISRTSIALGKVMYVLVAGLMNSISSVVGIAIGFQIMIRQAGNISIVGYESLNFSSAVLLLFTTIILSAIAASIVVYLGSLARNMKEASSYTMPFYLGAMFVAFATQNMDPTKASKLFFVPIINCIFALKNILVAQITFEQFFIMSVINVALISFIIYMISKLYNSERVLYTTS